MLSLNKKSFYVISSFLTGFSVMVVELISSRIVAPIIGASVFTWTSVIGLTLFGLALGGWFGGRLADSQKINTYIPATFVLSAIFVSLIPKLAEHTNFITNASHSILLLNLLLSLYLFFIPACTIGAIQPLLLKKYADVFSSIGSKYGTLSAAWSIGSMAGVFLTGFFFISTIGSTETVWLVSLILFVLSGVYGIHSKRILTLIFISLSILGLIFSIDKKSTSSHILYEKETDYYTARVIDNNIPPYEHSRILLLDLDAHSIDSPISFRKEYTDMYPVFSYLKPTIEDILVIGAGAYTLPKHFSEYYKDSQVTVVEVDPAMIDISNTYFNLEQYNIHTEINDAVLFTKKTERKYDVIFGDAYNSYISVPWYLLTHEWNSMVRTKLTVGGVYAINFIGSLEGPNARLTESIIRTFKATFSNYYIFAFGREKTATQNIVVVGINGDLPLSEHELIYKLKEGGHTAFARFITPQNSSTYSSGIFLTNNFSPTESLMLPVVTEFFSNNLLFIKKILAG